MLLNRKTKRRHGVGTVETVCVAVFIVIGLLLSIGTLGSFTSKKLESDAKEITNRESLMKRFCGKPSLPVTEEEEGYVKSNRRKGNNGVGNGEDPQPPGDPPINDGPGTSPGNPGNRGGALR